jgi:predicted glycosyltransferase/nucleoside-diphosphate-sugar epimerase
MLGHEVLGVDCFHPYYDPELKRRNMASLHDYRHFRLVEADLSTADLEPLVDGAEWVFHLAGQPGVRSSWGAQFAEYERHNIGATQRLLEALRTRPPQRLVYASSSSVYGDAPLPMHEDALPLPLSPYGITKLAAEQLVRAYWKSYGVPANMLRLFTVYGPRQRPDMAFNRFIAALGRGQPVPLYDDGSQTREFTYVSDVVAAFLRAAVCERTGEVINVGGGSSVTVQAVLRLLADITGKDVRVERGEAQRGDVRHTVASTERAGTILDWAPEVPLTEGLYRQVEWHLGATAVRALRAPVSTTRPAQSGPRFLLYGHDTYGLGHLRRNLALASMLTREFPDLSILLLTGSPAIQHFVLPEHVDYIKLPAVVKVASEDYQALSLQLQPAEIVRMRTALVRETVAGFAPDVVLIDHAPVGMKGEILPALQELRRSSPRSRVVLGLRDILDEPERVRKQWTEQGIYEVLEHYYDSVLVYGVPQVLDVVKAYAFPPGIAAKTRYLGYLKREAAHMNVAAIRAKYACTPDEQLVVITAGGGGDGYPLLSTYLTGLRSHPESPLVSVVVTGPFMAATERAELKRLASRSEHVRLVEFADDLVELMHGADLVVCMGGHNTLSEVLSVGVPALVVPRVKPRREQLLRAQAFEQLGLVSVLPPDQLGPELLMQRVSELLAVDHHGTSSSSSGPLAAFIGSGALNGLDTLIQAIGDALRQAAPGTLRAS